MFYTSSHTMCYRLPYSAIILIIGNKLQTVTGTHNGVKVKWLCVKNVKVYYSVILWQEANMWPCLLIRSSSHSLSSISTVPTYSQLCVLRF